MNNNYLSCFYQTLDANKKPITILKAAACFGSFKYYLQLSNPIFLNYRLHNKIIHPHEIEFWNVMKEWWFMPRLLKDTTIDSMNAEGVIIPVKEFNIFEVFAGLTLIRYLDFYNSNLLCWYKKYWTPYKEILTPLQTFVALNKHSIDGRSLDGSHSLWGFSVPITLAVDSPTLEVDIAANFPKNLPPIPKEPSYTHIQKHDKTWSSFNNCFDMIFRQSLPTAQKSAIPLHGLPGKSSFLMHDVFLTNKERIAKIENDYLASIRTN